MCTGTAEIICLYGIFLNLITVLLVRKKCKVDLFVREFSLRNLTFHHTTIDTWLRDEDRETALSTAGMQQLFNSSWGNYSLRRSI